MLKSLIARSLKGIEYSEMFQIVYKMLPCYKQIFVNLFLQLLLELVAQRNPSSELYRFFLFA